MSALPTSSTNENPRDWQFIISEAPGQLSRDQGIIQAVNDGLTKYYAGLILGRQTVPTLTAAPHVGNTGNATIAAGTASNAPISGTYKATCLTATTFNVTDPNGNNLGNGVFATAFNAGGIAFTITAGGTACVAGDYFTVTSPTTSGSYAPLAPAATDGTQNFAAINGMQQDVSTSVSPNSGLLTRNAEVKALLLNWGTLNQAQIDAALVQMLAVGIVLRTTEL